LTLLTKLTILTKQGNVFWALNIRSNMNRGENMYKGIPMDLSKGLVVTFFSMAVVFAALIVISYSIDVMRFFVEKNKK